MVRDDTISHALIIGAMKAGTTSLFRYLRQHPKIAGSLQKEPQFFSDETKVRRGLRYYNRLWPLAGIRRQIRLEASTNYSKFPTFDEIPSRISSYEMNQKFIYLVRNPLQRALSHYNHSILHNRECSVFDDHVVNLSKYYLQLSQYLKYFSKQDILIVSYEQLSQDPQEALKDISNFLRLEPYSFKAHKKYNVSDYNVSKKHSLSKEEQSHLHKLLEKDMISFKKEFDFDTSIWGFE